MLSVNASNLDFVLVGNGIEGILVSHQFWQLDVHGSSHGCSKVSWARGDVTEVIVMCKFDNGLDMFSSSTQPLEYCSNISTWLHRNDSQLILFIDPHKESFAIVMEDAST